MDGALPARRPRAVADVPAVDPVALTKAWLVALVLEAPLARAADVPAAELARGGPALCTALVAALGTDAELQRLEALAPSVGRLVGAAEPGQVVAGVEALRAVTWRALREALRGAQADVVADLAERLAHLCGLLCAAALTGGDADAAHRPDDGPPPGVRVVGPAAAPDAGQPIGDPLDSLADELDTAADEDAEPRPPTVRRRRHAGWESQAAAAPPWLAAIVRRLERYARDRRPFAVLLVEVDDLDRLLAAGVGQEVGAALETAERALTAELAPADLVVRERLGRWWVTAPERDGASGRELAERVARAIATASLHGAPLSASVGVAACPADGTDLDTLAGRADEGMFAARAAGVPVA